MRFDLDKNILFILPIVLSILLIVLKDDVWLFMNSLVLALIFYELIIFKYRSQYGFSGVRILSMPSIVLLSYTTLIALPAVYIACINQNPMRYPYFFAILTFYIFYPIGLLTSNRFFFIKTHNINQFYHSTFQKSPVDEFIYELLLILFTFSLMVFALYLYRTPAVPLIEMITNPLAYSTLWLLREESMKLLQVTFMEKYLFAWLRDLFLPFGILGSLFLSVTHKQKRYNYLFILFLTLGIVNNSLTIAKAPTAALFLGIAALFFMKQQRISLKFIIFFTILIFIFPYIVYHFVSSPEFRSPENLLNSMFLRVFVIPAEVLFEYFKIFPINHEFLLGRCSNLFSWLHSDGLFNLANYVAKVWWKLPFTTGNANSVYVGYFWADFGWIGVILSSFGVGFFIHFLFYKLLQLSNYQKNIFYVTFTTATVMAFSFTFVSTNFTSILLTRGLLLILLLLYIFNWILKNTTLQINE